MSRWSFASPCRRLDAPCTTPSDETDPAQKAFFESKAFRRLTPQPQAVRRRRAPTTTRS
ncbi:hypothetical protein ACRAWD_30210 [Caulobacter segnis]